MKSTYPIIQEDKQASDLIEQRIFGDVAESKDQKITKLFEFEVQVGDAS
jgi:hypothetical protein